MEFYERNIKIIFKDLDNYIYSNKIFYIEYKNGKILFQQRGQKSHDGNDWLMLF